MEKNSLACVSMDSEKSAATTPLKRPLLTNLLENRPLPQLMSTSTWACMVRKGGALIEDDLKELHDVEVEAIMPQ